MENLLRRKLQPMLRPLLVLIVVTTTACSDSDNKYFFEQLASEPMPIAADTISSISRNEPIRPLPPVSAESLVTPMVSLGRALFHDNRLSGDGTLNCSSCHMVDQGGDDNLATATGIRGQKGPINSPTVLNSGYNFRQFWNGRARTLADQAAGPVEAGIEMGADWDTVVENLSADKELRSQFKEAFGSDDITVEKVTTAIARYETSLSTPSDFDRYLMGQQNAISHEAKEGYALFKHYGCVGCHQGINVGGNLYQSFNAVQAVDIENFTVDKAGPESLDRDHAVSLVKVPSLRNIELTAPYFNGGRIDDLEIAVKIMGLSQTGTDIPDKDIKLIVEFLKSLTGDWQQHADLIN